MMMMPSANPPANSTPMMASIRKPERRDSADTASDAGTAHTSAPRNTLAPSRNAAAIPVSAECAMASPRKAIPRSTTKTPTTPQATAASADTNSARCINPYCKGSISKSNNAATS